MYFVYNYILGTIIQVLADVVAFTFSAQKFREARLLTTNCTITGTGYEAHYRMQQSYPGDGPFSFLLLYIYS
jgi:hypothetical protein